MQSQWQPEWAQLIGRFRRAQGLKQAAFASVLGVDQATVSRWESGRSVPEFAMQRKLRDLLWKFPANDALLKHRTMVSPIPTILSSRGWILTASHKYAEDHGVHYDQIVGMSAVPTMSSEGIGIWSTSNESFYRGEVASVTLVARWNSLSGHVRGGYGKSVWTPVRLADKTIIRHTVRVSLSEEEYHREREINGGAVQVVAMDELCG